MPIALKNENESLVRFYLYESVDNTFTYKESEISFESDFKPLTPFHYGKYIVFFDQKEKKYNPPEYYIRFRGYRFNKSANIFFDNTSQLIEHIKRRMDNYGYDTSIVTNEALVNGVKSTQEMIYFGDDLSLFREQYLVTKCNENSEYRFFTECDKTYPLINCSHLKHLKPTTTPTTPVTTTSTTTSTTTPKTTSTTTPTTTSTTTPKTTSTTTPTTTSTTTPTTTSTTISTKTSTSTPTKTPSPTTTPKRTTNWTTKRPEFMRTTPTIRMTTSTPESKNGFWKWIFVMSIIGALFSALVAFLVCKFYPRGGMVEYDPSSGKTSIDSIIWFNN